MKQIKYLTFAIFATILSFNAAATLGTGGELQKTLRKEITYPAFANSEKYRGMVLVSYEITSEGRIIVKAMNASDPELAAHVKKKLEALRFDPRELEGMHHAKFVFRKE